MVMLCLFADAGFILKRQIGSRAFPAGDLTGSYDEGAGAQPTCSYITEVFSTVI